MRTPVRSVRYPIFLLLFVFTVGCEPRPAAPDPDMATPADLPEAVLAHSGSVLGRYEPLQIQLRDAPEQDAAGMVSIRPRVEGEFARNGRVISFTPATGWAPDTDYRVAVALSRFVADAEDYAFSFTSPALRLQLLTDGIYFPDPANADRIEVRGRVTTSDDVSLDEVAEVINAAQGQRALEVTVTEGRDRRHFDFRVSGADRSLEPSAVRVWVEEGAGVFVSPATERTVVFTPPGQFELTTAVVSEEEGNNVVLLTFSDPLAADQDLAGLLRFADGASFTSRVDGNLLRLFPAADAGGAVTLLVDRGIRSSRGDRLGSGGRYDLFLGTAEPALRAVGEGVLIPHRGRRQFPFEAVGLSAVRYEIFKIYAGNAGNFLHQSDLDSEGNDWMLRPYGQVVASGRLPLNELGTVGSRSQWVRYHLDLDQHLGEDDGAIYQIRLGFGMNDAANDCGSTLADFNLPDPDGGEADDFTVGFPERTSFLGDYSGMHGEYADFEWDHRDDPCKPAYYNRDRFLSRNLISTNLGLIAKRNPDRSTLVFATDLLSGGPREGVTVTALSEQNQELFRGTTDARGRVAMTTEAAPFVIRATAGNDYAYLKLAGSPELSLSRFATEGTEAAGGIKGAFYAERGVWRPGDSIYLHFVLEDREARLPADYPIEATLFNPRGRAVTSRTVRPAFGSGLYPLPLATRAADETGNYRVEVRAAGRTYSRVLPVESVQPNRLAIRLDAPAPGPRPGAQLSLGAEWLYGAPGGGLRATVDLRLRERRPDFPGWGEFRFVDPARPTDSGESRIFEGTLSAEGTAAVDLPELSAPASGPLFLQLATRVYEPGGNFSIDNQRLPYDPYTTYAGVQLPEDRWGNRSIPEEGTTAVTLAAVDPAGKPRSGRKLTAGLYRVDWRYWWQDNDDNVARFSSSQHTEALETFTTTTGGDGTGQIAVSVPHWGRYLLRVCDEGGHCAGEYFYAGWSATAGDRESAALLRLSAEREEVAVGEDVVVRLPSSAGGNVLVSLETGAGTQEQFWLESQPGETVVRFPATAAMVPTVYANLTLLQNYDQTTNDRPLRLYGVVPVRVTDPATVLQPTLEVADEWAPEQRVSVRVSEATGRPMTYTLAVVDEGLLGLTRFQTPNLHDAFFSKEALAVRTFDLYRYVLSSLGGEFGQALATGGDGTTTSPEDRKANRFAPVVRHLGPFRLAAGQTADHNLKLPNYVGAVRAMVVASDRRAYGSAERRVPVRQPLMVLPTLPRVLGPGELVEMPVNVFAMDQGVRDVSVSVSESGGYAELSGGTQRANFSRPGDQLLYFPVQVGERAGIAKFSVSASGNGERASQDIEIDVRLPNETDVRSEDAVLPAGEDRRLSYRPFGVVGTRSAVLELSTLPPLKLSRHLDYLLRYPYGCVEQTISPALAQVVLDRVTELSPGQEAERVRNVESGLAALRRFQTGAGGMGYWPGDSRPHPWASSYALHFLAAAERAGFAVPLDVKSRLVRFQRQAADRWRESGDDFYSSADQRRRDQAYRVYALARAGEAPLGAMNRLRDRVAELPATGRFQLAAAYALAGRRGVATELLANASTRVEEYRETGYTFGSQLRDQALVLESLVAAGDAATAGRQAIALARDVSRRRWLSTQEAAVAILALAGVMDGNSEGVQAEFTAPGGGRSTVGSQRGIVRIELPTEGAEAGFGLNNRGGGNLYATVITQGKPRAGEEQARQDNLRLTTAYRDLAGEPLDVSELRSGTEFEAIYTVSNPGNRGRDYRQLALRTLVPSGWEIGNTRLANGDGEDAGGSFDYQDFRDDRVYTFFDLAAGEAKVFRFRMTATYPGRYYLPSQVGEAMYDNDVRAVVKGQWVSVGR